MFLVLVVWPRWHGVSRVNGVGEGRGRLAGVGQCRRGGAPIVGRGGSRGRGHPRGHVVHGRRGRGSPRGGGLTGGKRRIAATQSLSFEQFLHFVYFDPTRVGNLTLFLKWETSITKVYSKE